VKAWDIWDIGQHGLLELVTRTAAFARDGEVLLGSGAGFVLRGACLAPSVNVFLQAVIVHD
jgi:hypothetical protein